jgi:hypothetical protein
LLLENAHRAYEKMGCYDDLALGLQTGDDMVTKETERCGIWKASERFCYCYLESDWLRRVVFKVPEAGCPKETSRIRLWKSPIWTLV